MERIVDLIMIYNLKFLDYVRTLDLGYINNHFSRLHIAVVVHSISLFSNVSFRVAVW